MDTAVEPHPGEKRPAVPNEEEAPIVQAAAQSPRSPPKKKKAKLDSAAQSLLTEIFALQDTFQDVEIEALARKVQSTRTQVINFFNSWKTSVNILVDKSKNKTPGFHTKVDQPVQPTPALSDGIVNKTLHLTMGEPLAPLFTASPTEIPLPQEPGMAATGPSASTNPQSTVIKQETIPQNRLESERLALNLVAAATTSRHNTAAALAPFLDPQGGVKDIQSAVNVSTYAQLTAALGEPTFTGQLQLCDALLATIDPSAYAFLCNSATLAASLQTLVSRGVKGKQITLAVRALRAMIHFRGFSRSFISYRTMQLLKSIVSGDINRSGPVAGVGASHSTVREAAEKLLSLYPQEEEEEKGDGGGSVLPRQQVESEKAPAPSQNIKPSEDKKVSEEDNIELSPGLEVPEPSMAGNGGVETEQLPDNAPVAAVAVAAAVDGAGAASPTPSAEEDEEEEG